MRANLLAIKIELRRIMHDPIAKTGAWVKRMLQGHLNYFAVSGNHPSLWWFLNKVKRLWLASLKLGVSPERHGAGGHGPSKRPAAPARRFGAAGSRLSKADRHPSAQFS